MCECNNTKCAEHVQDLLVRLDTAKEENQSFGNVLAIIHRDGGHYITEHGHDKASKDAIDIVLKLKGKLVEANEKNKRLQDEKRARRQWQSCPRCSKTFATQS